MTTVHVSPASLVQKNAPAILYQRRRNTGLFPAVGAGPAGSATPDEAHMNTIKVGDLVLPPGDDRPWRVLDLYHGKAQIEFVGEAWTRIKTLPAGDLRIDPCERSTTQNA